MYTVTLICDLASPSLNGEVSLRQKCSAKRYVGANTANTTDGWWTNDVEGKSATLQQHKIFAPNGNRFFHGFFISLSQQGSFFVFGICSASASFHSIRLLCWMTEIWQSLLMQR